MLYLFMKGGDFMDKLELFSNYNSMLNDASFTLKLPKQLRDDFNQVAGKSSSAVIRRLMSDYIANQKLTDS